jgi:nucleoside-diphosphate-sugar epimerase
VEKALVTGGTGFLGSLISSALVEAGYEVTAIDIVDPGPDFPAEATFARCDITDPDAVRRAVEGVDIVVSNAALVPITNSSAQEYLRVNEGGTKVVLDAARGEGAYCCHVSSSAVFGAPRAVPVSNATPIAPFEDYGVSKAAGEAAVARARTEGLTASILRPRTLIAEGRLGLFDMIFSRVRAGKAVPLLGGGDNLFQLCDGNDFAAAVVASVGKRAPGDYNIGALEFGTVREDVQKLVDHAGTGSRLVPIPVWATEASLGGLRMTGLSPFSKWHWRSAYTPFYFDMEPVCEELGWRPKLSNAESMAKAYDIYLASPGASGNSAHRMPIGGTLARVLRG